MGHTNILSYCPERPFIFVEEMNRQIVARWNSKVSTDDSVWFLGDFCLNPRFLSYIKELNGKVKIVAGNHDRCHPCHKKWQKQIQKYLVAGFAEVYTEPVWFHGKFHALMSHFPYAPKNPPEEYKLRFMDYRTEDKGNLLLHGHIHQHWRRKGRQINVGVDAWGGYPVSEDELIDFIREEEDADPLPWMDSPKILRVFDMIEFSNRLE